jgi:hypothetical protein
VQAAAGNDELIPFNRVGDAGRIGLELAGSTASRYQAMKSATVTTCWGTNRNPPQTMFSSAVTGIVAAVVVRAINRKAPEPVVSSPAYCKVPLWMFCHRPGSRT